MVKRADGRLHNQVRPVRVTYGVYEYAAGSVLYEIGKTKVLCAVSMQEGVPLFLRGKGSGWLTAEYALLPTSTQVRTARESNSVKRNGRSVEISRLIGRSLRAVVDTDVFGERTVYIDCDVQQADGGTRTACITGAGLALKQAQERWLQAGIIKKPFLLDDVVAVSVALVRETVLLDVTFAEDSAADADFNFVLTASGAVIEVQGAAEKRAVHWSAFDQARALAVAGAQEIVQYTNDVPMNLGTVSVSPIVRVYDMQ